MVSLRLTTWTLRTSRLTLHCGGDRYQLQGTSVMSSYVTPSILLCASHWPHSMVKAFDLENVKAVPQSQIQPQRRRPGLVSFLELCLCTGHLPSFSPGSDGRG